MHARNIQYEDGDTRLKRSEIDKTAPEIFEPSMIAMRKIG
jgi:hypothetical protein